MNVELLHIGSNKVYSFDKEPTQEEVDIFQASDGSGYNYVRDYVMSVYNTVKSLAVLAVEFKTELANKEMPLDLYTTLTGKLLGLEFAVSNNRADGVIALLIALPIDNVYITQAFKDVYLTQLNLLL